MGTAILAATTQAAYVQKIHTLIWAYIPIRFSIDILAYYMLKCKYLFYILFSKIFIWAEILHSLYLYRKLQNIYQLYPNFLIRQI